MLTVTETIYRPDVSVPFWFELPEAHEGTITHVKKRMLEEGILLSNHSQISDDGHTMVRTFTLLSRVELDLMVSEFKKANPDNYQDRKRYYELHQHTTSITMNEGP
jgi:hypothetical protein